MIMKNKFFMFTLNDVSYKERSFSHFGSHSELPSIFLQLVFLREFSCKSFISTFSVVTASQFQEAAMVNAFVKNLQFIVSFYC